MLARAIDHARQVEGIALDRVGVIDHEALIVTAGIAVGAFGEVPADHAQAFKLMAGDKRTGGRFRQQATVR